jgi:ketosteroid isomerase-like protein
MIETMTTRANDTAEAVVAHYFAAFGSGDLQTARQLLKDDLSFTGPFDTFDNADDLIKALSALAPAVKGIQQRKVLVDGDDVATFYDMLTPMGTSPIAEWHHVTDGKIDAIRVYFDPRPFAHA